jgi:hypothetical protein
MVEACRTEKSPIFNAKIRILLREFMCRTQVDRILIAVPRGLDNITASGSVWQS